MTLQRTQQRLMDRLPTLSSPATAPSPAAVPPVVMGDEAVRRVQFQDTRRCSLWKGNLGEDLQGPGEGAPIKEIYSQRRPLTAMKRRSLLATQRVVTVANASSDDAKHCEEVRIITTHLPPSDIPEEANGSTTNVKVRFVDVG